MIGSGTWVVKMIGEIWVKEGVVFDIFFGLDLGLVQCLGKSLPKLALIAAILANYFLL